MAPDGLCYWLGETQIRLNSQPTLLLTRPKTPTELKFCNTKLEKGYTQFHGKNNVLNSLENI